VLEIGCGTGRVLRAVLDEGCHVTGVDISDTMLDVAAVKLHAYLMQGQLVLHKHDFRCAPLPEQYDRILVTFFTFNYLLTAAEQQHFLRHVRQSLTAHGVVVIDFFYPQPFARPTTSDQWHDTVLHAEGQQIALRQKRWMVGAIEERIQIYADGTHHEEIVTRRRYVSPTQAAVLLTQAGFHSLHVTHGYAASALRPMGQTETTESPFVCTASKLA
jgi:SAM-dependent methyltransferase